MRLRLRMNKHKYDCNHKDENGCKLSQHAVQNNHTFDFDNVKILEIEEKKSKREVLETIRIRESINKNNSVNSRSDIDNFKRIYATLL
jgi:hypothetical protein